MKKIPTILFVHHGVGIGGAAISLMQILLRLDPNLYKKKLVFMEYSAAVNFYKEQGIIIDEILGSTAFSHTVIWWYSLLRVHHGIKAFIDIFVTIFKAVFILKKYHPDIVHLNSTPLWPWLIISKIMKYRVVMHVREPLAKGYFGIRKFIIKTLIARLADKILAISYNDGQPWNGNSKLQILYNAVDEKRFVLDSRDKVVAKKMVFLYVGGASYEKGALFLLKIWQQVVSKGCAAELWIAGSWTDAKAYKHNCYLKRLLSFGFKTPQEAFFNKLDFEVQFIKENITFCGVVNNIAPLMSQADVLLFPCQTGHFARPVIEAAFLRKPSLASKLAPLEELILDNKTGFLLSHLSVDDWVNCIVNLSQDHQLAQHLGLCAQKNACSRFGLALQLKQLNKVYREILFLDFVY